MSNLFWKDTNIKRDKLSIGETPADNKQPSNQTNKLNFMISGWCVDTWSGWKHNQTESAVRISLGSSLLSFFSSLHNDLNTHSAATPSMHLQISGWNFQLSFLRRWCKSDLHWPDILKARSSHAGCNRYDRTRSALVPRVCVLVSELSDLFSQKRLVPGRFN